MTESNNTLLKASHDVMLGLYYALKPQMDNVLFSPLCILNILAILYEGSDGETQSELTQILGFAESDSTHNSNFGTIFKPIIDSSGLVNLLNSVWVDDLVAVSSKFSDSMLDSDVAINSLSLRDKPAACEAINAFIAKYTENKVLDFISPDYLDSLTKLILINVLFFKSEWEQPFEKENTEDRNFLLSNEKTIKVPMMFQSATLNYGQNDNVKVVYLPYKNSQLEMLVVLPHKNRHHKFISTETVCNWQDIETSEVDVDLYFPKLSLQKRYDDFQNHLISLGLSNTLSNHADFSNMTKEPLAIEKVMHCVSIDISEKGTEATAVTAVEFAWMGLDDWVEENTKVIFKVDRPFFFLIQDRVNKNVIFFGQINNPISQ